ncbi:hypothetical protein PGTUg99_035442 [Puccinia graminis f. sp. tritici]|uniref:Uncharacterized protein n=1 Tax=Puccinia graminis f. sp. tritici TaxID=56615 RepID=A0A5B0RUT7_PUCGR|nr:hypothetical protein PGTUg99_035442 [Puccinia graminis f. sp. tritici]
MVQFRPRQAPEPLPEAPDPPTLTSLSQQLIWQHQLLAHQAGQGSPAQLAPATVAAMEAVLTRLEQRLEIISNHLQLLTQDLRSLR